MRNQFVAEQSFEDQLLYIHGLDLAESDAVLNSWKEKVRTALMLNIERLARPRINECFSCSR